MKLKIEDSGIEVIRFILYPERKQTAQDALVSILKELNKIMHGEIITIIAPIYKGEMDTINIGGVDIPYEIVKVSTDDGLMLDNVFVYYKK